MGGVHGEGGGMCGEMGMCDRGCVWWGDMHGRGTCMASGVCMAGETATPAGMHSCFIFLLFVWVFLEMFKSTKRSINKNHV